MRYAFLWVSLIVTLGLGFSLTGCSHRKSAVSASDLTVAALVSSPRALSDGYLRVQGVPVLSTATVYDGATNPPGGDGTPLVCAGFVDPRNVTAGILMAFHTQLPIHQVRCGSAHLCALRGRLVHLSAGGHVVDFMRSNGLDLTMTHPDGEAVGQGSGPSEGASSPLCLLCDQDALLEAGISFGPTSAPSRVPVLLIRGRASPAVAPARDPGASPSRAVRAGTSPAGSGEPSPDAGRTPPTADRGEQPPARADATRETTTSQGGHP